MRLIVSDVTELGHSQVCVAGWCAEQRRMIRPLSGLGGAHWPSAHGNPALFWMGNIIDCEPTNVQNNRGRPHSHEDTIVQNECQLAETVTADRLALSLAASESPSMNALFRGNLQKGRYVMAGADCPSLGAVRVRRNTIEMYERDRDRGSQLRCRFVDAARSRFDLPVVSVDLKSRWRQGGVAAVNHLVRGHGDAHIRIGLANPFDDGTCWAMVNNIALY